MTCIAGVVCQGRVVIGGDSAGTAETSLTVRRDVKVFRIGEFVFGFTSSFRMGQIIQYSFGPPVIPANTDLHRYMATSFVNALRKALTEGGYARNVSGEETAGTFLVGVRGRLFSVESDYQIAEALDGYDAVGCGADVAKGSLFSTSGFMDPYDRVYKSLEAAQRHSSGVRAPFNIVSTDEVSSLQQLKSE